MSKITLYIASSLDGFIADEDGGVEWLETFDDTYQDGESGSSYEDFFESVECLVMGANTYEQILTFGDWPYGDRPTFITTHEDLPKKKEIITFYEGNVRALVEDTIPSEYEHIWIVGGAVLAQEFLKQDLIDEIRLSVIPVLLGDGIPLFGDSGSEQALHLMDSTAYESGIVELQYKI